MSNQTDGALCYEEKRDQHARGVAALARAKAIERDMAKLGKLSTRKGKLLTVHCTAESPYNNVDVANNSPYMGKDSKRNG